MSTLMQITEELPKLSTADLVELKNKQSVPWPDFAARLDRLFPDGPPLGPPLSQIVSEARGEY